MHESNTNKVTLITIMSIVVLLIFVAIAYFAIAVSNTNNEKYSLTSAKISIIYTDCASSKQSDCANITKNLALGESVEKTFKVRNDGTQAADFYIVFKELTNTFYYEDLVYTIKDINNNVLQEETSVPWSQVGATNVLAYPGTIEANTTKEYKIVIKFRERNADQTINSSATYSIKLGILASMYGNDILYGLALGANENSTDVITKPAPSGSTCTNTLAYDGTADNNLRYVGANPCNYVSFNGETPALTTKWTFVDKNSGEEYQLFDTESECNDYLQMGANFAYYDCASKTIVAGGWRIIGMMNNVDDGNNNIETRIKLVRNTPLGNYSLRDRRNFNINSGYGTNDWTHSDLKDELNGDYLDTTLTENTTWSYYSTYNNTPEYVGTFDYTKRLGALAQTKIKDAKWYLGGGPEPYYGTVENSSPIALYEEERGGIVWGSKSGQTCNDGECPRATTWTGKVGLQYSSDYAFAVGGSVRSTCLNSRIYDFETNNCISNDWIVNDRPFLQWLITPNTNGAYEVYALRYRGLASGFPIYTYGVLPTIYLNPDVTVTSGNGSVESPYVIG